MTTIIERVKFKVNGVDYEVGCEVTSKTTLVEYLRKVINIPGTKYMCLEGGCGACTVSVCRQPGDPEEAVNSGWEITTIEGLGNRKKGYHILQETLAKNNGSQCGHCTPGWIMAMYSLVQRKKRPTMKEIEQNLSSNVCRCTGYRSIFKAFKEFASDAPNLQDIEDLYRNDRNDCNTCNSWCFVTKEDVEKRLIKINLKDIKVWYRVSEIEDIFEIFTKEGDDYLLVAGNTAKGAYPISEYPRVLIDISGVEELMGHILDQNLVIGAGTTLTNLIDLFEEKAQEEYFTYLDQFRKHLTKVAHVAVRNLASVAGNLMLKHEHREFPSDIFLLLECVGAQLTLCSRSRQGTRMLKKVTMQEFLNTDMKEKIILNILIPPLSQESKIVTYKIMPRGQSAIAIVNAAFNYKVIDNKIVECSIVYGGLSDNFTRAKNTERCLKGEKISNDTLQKALKILDCELVVTEGPPKSSVEYRRHLALALFYKSVLTLCTEDIVRRNYRSGTIDIHNTRPASVATQVFKTDPALWPLNQPIPKVDGLIQCAGEAVYTDDIPRVPHETAAAFVLSSVPTGEIVKIDATEALNYKGVLAFYTAKDIPGLNSFTPADDVIGINNEEVFCDTFVKYHSQPLGLIVAETAEIANIAVKLVEVTYKDVKTPVLSIEDAKRDASRVTLFKTINATARGDNVVKVIKGSNSVYGQYHFPMENIVCLTQKTEEGLRVDATAQWFNAMQLMISRALKLDQNRIDLHMRRLGGSYGLKVSRSIQTAVACSQVAYLLNRPCRLVLPLQVVTKAVGKRLPCDTEFEIGVDSTGKIQYMNYDLYEDNGYLINEQFLLIIVEAYNNCYDKSAWNFRAFNVITDTHKNSWFRAPGHIETVAMAEYVMEQIAYELQLDPIDVRVANLSAEHLEIKEMIESIRTNSNYDERRRLVEKFNSENRWVKRGLRLSIMQWSPRPIGRLHVTLSVYHGDGTIALTHSGIELGQGLNTKAIQICAYLLNIPTHKIQVKENNTIIGPNVYATVGSLGGQNVALGVTECCEELLKRLEPIRSQMPNASWEDLIQTAFEMNVDLQTHGFVSVDDTAKYQYSAYGVAVAEVEVDILTGECEVIRVDLEEDVGLSMSPLIDIGQVEGAFIMGQGYWTCEDLVYDRLTGEVLTDRSWNYHVPLGTDIPQDFRVYLREKSYTYKEIFGSKAVGEPPICLSIVIAFAIREAISSARCDLGIPSTKWFPIKGPYTVEKIALAARTKIKDFKI